MVLVCKPSRDWHIPSENPSLARPRRVLIGPSVVRSVLCSVPTTSSVPARTSYTHPLVVRLTNVLHISCNKTPDKGRRNENVLAAVGGPL